MMKSRHPVYGYGMFILIILAVVVMDILVKPYPPLPCHGLILYLSLGWALFFLAILFVLSRKVEASDDGLVIYGSQRKKLVPYRDLSWVIEFTNSRGPAFICTKYYDRTHLRHRIILFVPPRAGWREESGLTRFIRGRIEQANPAYSRDAEPRKWKVMVVFYLSIIMQVVILKLSCPGFLS